MLSNLRRRKEMRGKRSTAKKLARDRAEIESQQKIMNDIIFRNEPGIMCLACEDEAQTGDLWIGFVKKKKKKSGSKGVLSCAPESLEADDLNIDVYSDEVCLQGFLAEGTLGHENERARE
jgi:hypothetical protein